MKDSQMREPWVNGVPFLVGQDANRSYIRFATHWEFVGEEPFTEVAEALAGALGVEVALVKVGPYEAVIEQGGIPDLELRAAIEKLWFDVEVKSEGDEEGDDGEGGKAKKKVKPKVRRVRLVKPR